MNCVRSIKILSPSEVSHMTQDQFEILDAAAAAPPPPPPIQQQAASSNSEDVAHTQTSAPNPNMDP